jgi:hypothetical protein
MARQTMTSETVEVEVTVRMQVFGHVPTSVLRDRIEKALHSRRQWDYNNKGDALWNKATVAFTQTIPPTLPPETETMTMTLDIADFRAVVAEEVAKALAAEKIPEVGRLY